jgi:hypothetical protein
LKNNARTGTEDDDKGDSISHESSLEFEGTQVPKYREPPEDSYSDEPNGLDDASIDKVALFIGKDGS